MSVLERLDAALAEIRAEKVRPCYLLWGEEEYLVEDSYRRLVDAIITPPHRDFNLFVTEGDNLELNWLCETLLTFPIIPGRKAVVVKRARFLQPDRGTRYDIDHIRELAGSDLVQAAREFATFLRQWGWSLDDLLESDEWKKSDNGKWQFLGNDRTWIPKVLDACLIYGIKAAEMKGEEELVYDLLSTGLPDGHTLIMTASSVNERSKLYQLIASVGWVLHFPRVSSEREKRARLIDFAKGILSAAGKKLTDGAWNQLGAKTGYDLREAMSEIEKLILLTGNKSLITEEDVKEGVEKTKTESVFHLVAAIARREEKVALKLLNDLFDEQVAPLNIVSLLARELRHLVRARTIIDKRGLSVESMEMRDFQRSVLPNLKEDSPELASLPPYGAFHVMKNAARFRYTELTNALRQLAYVDKLLKTTSCDARMVIENFILSFRH
ncbi:MAG: DNA polymerase III subunit delta [Syntrophales bacterium]|nr:DNA polymerase III subunit delta [Syntrophales bacterium]